MSDDEPLQLQIWVERNYDADGNETALRVAVAPDSVLITTELIASWSEGACNRVTLSSSGFTIHADNGDFGYQFVGSGPINGLWAARKVDAPVPVGPTKEGN